MTGIYKITNIINNKIYIGQTLNSSKRWEDHKLRSLNPKYRENSHLYSAMYKYGIENFEFSIIEKCSPVLLNEREMYWIAYYDSTNREIGYNISTGGSEGGTNWKLSLEDVREIKTLLKTTRLTQEEIGAKFNVGKWMIGEMNKGKAWTDENEIYPLRSIHISRKHENYPEREILKQDIRKFSTQELSSKYAVSNETVRKWCKGYNIPYKRKDVNTYSDDQWSEV